MSTQQKKYMNGGCGHDVHFIRTCFAQNMEV